MSLKAENRYHFGLSIYESELTRLAERKTLIIDKLKSMRELDQGLNRSNQRGWQSRDDLHLIDDEDFRWLSKELYQLVSQLIQHAEKLPDDSRIQFVSFWANFNDAGDWNAPHSHMPCEWSGVLYLDVPETTEQPPNGPCPGDILFLDPVPIGPPYRKSKYVAYSPKPSQLFLFPGFLMHMVAPHYDESVTRISMAFNFRLAN